MNPINLGQIKKVGQKTIADFVHSETGSVGIKNAAVIGAFAAALAISTTIAEATTCKTTYPNGKVITAI